MKVIFLCGTNRNWKFEESLIEYKNYLKKAIDKSHTINSHTEAIF